MEPLIHIEFSLGSSFVALEKLGEGGYGAVYRVKERETNTEYAIKIMKNQHPTEGVPKYAMRELSLLKKLSHPNIIQINKYVVYKTHIEICMEYCKYDLYSFRKNLSNDRSLYNEQTIKKIMFQFIQGINYLHSNMIMHRDLKPQNILLNFVNGEPFIKICDFNLSKKYTIPIKPYSPGILTLNYKAPEVIVGQSSYSIGVDMWSLGCICVELFINKGLFNCKSDLELLQNHFQIIGKYNENILAGTTSLRSCNLNNTEYKPLGIRKVIEDNSYLGVNDSFVNLIEQLLQVDPSQRITCKDVLLHVRIR